MRYLLFFSIALLVPLVTYAYLDPGSGSYALQIFFAALFGIALSIKPLWRKLKQLLTLKRKNRKNSTL
jgi:membrane protease YdiL (CAAX protease family)